MPNKFLLSFSLFFFSFSSFSQDLESSNLPIIQIFTNGTAILDEPKISATMGIINNDFGNRNEIDDPFNEYNGFVGIEFRGATSQQVFDKKSYSIETRDSLGNNRNVSLLGMPKENDWILYGPYSDKSLIRNALVYKTAGKIMDYAPRYTFVELMINGDYRGLYLFAEKIKRDKNRVNISQLNQSITSGDSLTGGYILKLDKESGAESDGFVSQFDPNPGGFQQTYFQYHYPKPKDINPEQENYIRSFMDEFENLLDSDAYADSLDGYAKYIDPSTFVDFFIVNELFKNVDAYRLSTFMYKDRNSIDGRLKLGPVWDFNLGMGNVDFCLGAGVEGWVKDYNTTCPEDNWLVPFWWKRFWKDKNFRIAITKRWKELRQGPLSDGALFASIDSLTNELQEAQERNFKRWPVLSTYIWPNWFVGDTYEEEVDYLTQWLEDRIFWIENQMEVLPLDLYDANDYFAPRAFPNPFHNELTFEYYIQSKENLSLRIFNAQGKLVAEQLDSNHPNGLNTLDFDSSHFSPGIYFYQIWINEEIKNTGKIVKAF